MRKRNADLVILVKHVDTLLVKLEYERRNSSGPIDMQIMLRLHALKISMAMLSVIDDSAEDDVTRRFRQVVQLLYCIPLHSRCIWKFLLAGGLIHNPEGMQGLPCSN